MSNYYKISIGLLILSVTLLYFRKPLADRLFKPELSHSEIIFNYHSINFGKLPRHKRVKAEFVLTNRGKQPVEVLKVETGCHCTVPGYVAGELMPGKTKEISVTYSSPNVGYFEENILVYTNTPDSPYLLEITGTVTDIFSWDQNP